MEDRTWHDIPEEQMNALVTRRVLHTGNLTIARIQLLKGAVVPWHHHVSEQITTLESGRLVFRFEGRDVNLEAGHILDIPANLPHAAEAMEDSVAIDVFSPRREDWIRGDDSYLRK